MIKKLFTLKLVLLYMVTSSQVLTYVGNSAVVTIQPQTLLYNGGGLQTATGSVVNNSGNVMINGASGDLLALASTANFNLKLNSLTSYGQLYLTGIAQGNISGKVNKEYRADANSGSTAKQQMGLPFFDYKIADLGANLAASTGTNPTAGNYLNVTNTANNSAGRFSPNSVFKWSNASARFNQIAAGPTALATTNVGTALDYYIIPRRNSSGVEVWNAALSSAVSIFSGSPVSDVTTIQSLPLTGAAGGINFGYNGSASNYFGERYFSYLDDPFQSKTANAGGWDASYGKNLYQVANPFLTNIDLRYIGTAETPNSDNNAIPSLQGIAYYTSGLTWVRTAGTSYPAVGLAAGQTVVVTATAGVFQSGDVSANRLVIKPMGEFMIKLSQDNGINNLASRIDFTLLRRFAGSSRNNATQTTNPSSKTNDDDTIPADKIVKQLAVIAYDMDSLEIGRTYYAVSPSAFTGRNSANTLLQAYTGDQSSIFTREELATGGQDENTVGKLYINEANEMDFAAKKIPLSINYSDTPYYLEFQVYEKGNRVGEEGLTTGKNFYIETANNTFVKISDGDYLTMSGSQNLGLYYDKPDGATLGSNNAVASQTIIAKKDNQWVVKFAKDWKKATVEVYSAAGQLLSTKSQISTENNYMIPLSYQVKGIFVVRATSDNGEVVIKKIIN